MAGDIVYADLNIAGASSRPPHPSQHLSLPQCPHWHRIALGVGWAGNVILAGAVIVLGVWVLGGSRLEDLVSRLKQGLCHSAQSPSADGSSCKLCPMDWLSHRGKCYWFSKDSKTWNESRADCSAKSSRKLVIQDGEEMAFIENITRGLYHVWLGLRVTSPGKNWTWVDSSMLDQTLFPVTGPADVNSCGVIKGNRIHSETCSAEFKWICQKEAMPL
ncbi:killer cell lectin-like receptor subfamily B member 1B allele C [Lepidochelys kempii]|uniref:killer cell lectin-like receptor subfamily B member 1B allele C n=1 Tax=Lepidochelys kempii TaxID=8472 RepID=UPI003C6EA8B8